MHSLRESRRVNKKELKKNQKTKKRCLTFEIHWTAPAGPPVLGEAPPLPGLVCLFFRVAFLPAGIYWAWIRSDGYFPESCGNRLVLQLTVDRPISPDAGLAPHFKVRESWLILFILNWPTFSEGWG